MPPEYRQLGDVSSESLVEPQNQGSRLRIGTARVIYGFDGIELLISVLRVGHRSEIYRK